MEEQLSARKMSKDQRRRRRQVYARYQALKYEVRPVERIRIMNEEFGPYWYFYLNYRTKIPAELKETERYMTWQVWKSQNAHLL